MSKWKFRTFSIISMVLLALVVLLNLSATFAWYSSRKQLKTETLEIGTIKLNANNEIGAGGYFASSTLENVRAGDYILSDDVTFSLEENSDPAYIRAKYKVRSRNYEQNRTAENDLESYLKYGNMVVGENLFDISKVVSSAYVVNNGNSLSVTPSPSSSGVSASSANTLKDYLPNAVAGKTYTLNAQTDGTMKNIYLLKSASSWSFGSKRTLTQNDLDSIVYWYATGDKTFTATISNIQVVEDYYWSEKVGDYYYLLDSSTGNPLVVSDSTKTYTFLTKENSKINKNYFSDNNVSGTTVKLSIGLEAIQVANLTFDSSESDLESIQEKLDEVNNVNSTGTHNVTFVINGTNYSVSNINYAKNATLPTAVISKINETDFSGFAFSQNGYPVITKQSRGHSWIDLSNSSLNNITEDLVLYAVDGGYNVSEYDIVFKNDSNIIQQGKTSAGIAVYLGETPTKTSTSTKDYEFIGWKIDGDQAGTVYKDLSTLEISNNTTFVASFEEKNRTYEICYVLNGGSFEQSKISNIKVTYTFGSTTTLPAIDCMFKQNYTFAGWFESSDFSGNAVTEISSTQTGNKTYYAKWVLAS